MMRLPPLLFALVAAVLPGCAASAPTPVPPASPRPAANKPAPVAFVAGTYRQDDGRTLHLLPGGKYFYTWDSDLDVFPPAYDAGTWKQLGAEVTLTRTTRLSGIARAPLRYGIEATPGIDPPTPQLTAGTMNFKLAERLDGARGAELAKNFEETNRQAEVFNDLHARLDIQSEEAEIAEGSWNFSGKCSIDLNGAFLTADRIETNRNGSILKLSGDVRIKAGPITRDLPSTTLRFEEGALVSAEPRIDLSP